MKKDKYIISKKDIVIPEGTLFYCVDGMKVEYVNDNYETLISITKDNTGFFSVSFDEENFECKEDKPCPGR